MLTEFDFEEDEDDYERWIRDLGFFTTSRDFGRILESLSFSESVEEEICLLSFFLSRFDFFAFEDSLFEELDFDDFLPFLDFCLPRSFKNCAFSFSNL
jgi:hypothetical protein